MSLSEGIIIWNYFKNTERNISVSDVVNKEQKFGYIMLLSDRSDRTYPDTDSNIYKTAIEYASIVIILRMQIRISNRMDRREILLFFCRWSNA